MVYRTYQEYKSLLQGNTFPYAVLDMDLFRENIQLNLERAVDKKIRIASKSIRCVEVMRLILDYNEQFQGIMAYHGAEALHLVKQGFDDILLGYPVVDRELIRAIGKEVKKGKQICLMIDSPEHLQLLNSAGKKLTTKIPVCIDMDLSDDYPGLHFGVWRSGIRSLEDLRALLQELTKMDFIQLDGLMGYEAQVAGVSDDIRGSWLKNTAIRLLKKRSIRNIRKKRAAAVNLIQEEGFLLRFINGGGTGSLESTTEEKVVTEVTVGSGFYNAHYFDNYQKYQLHPALFYAIQVVRKPAPGVYTCHEGGYIASGAIEKIKEPIVYLPESGKLDPLEGAGEVQTPIRFSDPSIDLAIGDPVFMRHAKSGELCERFDEITLIEKDTLTTAKTYRGAGLNFG